jgi:hypothetical protein
VDTVLYTYESWTDSNLTFCKCLPNDEVMDIYTNVNSGKRFTMQHVEGINGFLPNAQLTYLQQETTITHATNFEKKVTNKIISNFPPVNNCAPITVSSLTNYHHPT